MKVTKAIQNKINAINAVVGEGDNGEVWIDKNGTKIPINRAPIDWSKCAKPREVIYEKQCE